MTALENLLEEFLALTLEQQSLALRLLSQHESEERRKAEESARMKRWLEA
jgi:hypothetical protein